MARTTRTLAITVYRMVRETRSYGQFGVTAILAGTASFLLPVSLKTKAKQSQFQDKQAQVCTLNESKFILYCQTIFQFPGEVSSQHGCAVIILYLAYKQFSIITLTMLMLTAVS
jgi:hypothetical protein